MARRYVPQIFDDLDGTELTESDATEIHFSVDGTAYMLEVSEDNARKFHEALEPFISSATNSAYCEKAEEAPWPVVFGLGTARIGRDKDATSPRLND